MSFYRPSHELGTKKNVSDKAGKHVVILLNYKML